MRTDRHAQFHSFRHSSLPHFDMPRSSWCLARVCLHAQARKIAADELHAARQRTQALEEERKEAELAKVHAAERLQAERELRAEQEKHLSKIEKEKNAAIEKNAAMEIDMEAHEKRQKLLAKKEKKLEERTKELEDGE